MKANQGMIYAGFWIRFYAILIDKLILLVIYLPILWIFGRTSFPTFESVNIKTIFSPTFFIGIFVDLLYFGVLQAKMGATLGKKLFGLQVVNAQMKPVTVNQMLMRTLMSYLSSLILHAGNFAVALSEKKAGLA